MTCTEFFPPSWFAARARLREAEEVIAALAPEGRERMVHESLTGTTVFAATYVLRCHRCGEPQRIGDRVVRVPDTIKPDDPAWYVQHLMDNTSGRMLWCEDCLYSIKL